MSSTAPVSLRRTPLFERHVQEGGKMVDFAGWEMPIQYAARGDEGSPIVAEHQAVRRAAGVFDVSHMGEIETSGCSQTMSRSSRSAARSTASCAARTAACWTTCSPTVSVPSAT